MRKYDRYHSRIKSMETKKLSVVAHGGAGSENTHSDGTKKAR